MNSKINLVINSEFNTIDAEKEIKCVNSISDLNNKDEKFREFIEHFNKDAAKECLVSML